MARVECGDRDGARSLGERDERRVGEAEAEAEASISLGHAAAVLIAPGHHCTT